MRDFDHDYVEEAIGRLKQLKAGASPAWGKMTPEQMIEHLANSVRYSMGRLGDVPDKSNWLLRRIVAPLIMRGVIRIPKNIRGSDFPKRPYRDDLETLHAVLEEYLAVVQAGELEPKPHPGFGDIGVDGWAAMHYLHFEHHLRQFGV